MFLFADLEAGRLNIAQVDEARIPQTRDVLRKGWFVIVPFVVLLGGLFVMNMRPETAALYAVLSLFLLSLIRTYDGGRIAWTALVQVLIRSGKTAVEVVLICAIAGMIIGLFARSGLSFGMGFFLVQLGKSSLILLLLVTAVVCILMGMGLPTVGVYLLLSTLAAAPLIELGLNPMPAHLFVLYFGMLSMLTPPVAIAAFVAANMAKAPPMRTGFEAVRIAWPAFVVPFLFVADTGLLFEGSWATIVQAIVLALIGVYFVTSGLVGFVSSAIGWGPRLGLIAAGIAVLWPPSADQSLLIHAVGLLGGFALVAVLRHRGRLAVPG